MSKIYICRNTNCMQTFYNIIEYYEHIKHKEETTEYYGDYKISHNILQYFIKNDIEPLQEIFDDMIGDGDVLFNTIKTYDNEKMET